MAKGRELGFPTANIDYRYQISPANGIYAAWVKIEDENVWRQGAISTGIRPHYNGKKKRGGDSNAAGWLTQFFSSPWIPF